MPTLLLCIPQLCQRFIEDTHNEYVKLDEYKKTNLIDYISSIRVDPNVAVILGPGNNPFANWKDRISEIVFDTDEEKDLLSTVKTLCHTRNAPLFSVLRFWNGQAR